ncbi:universal stress protein [Goodfellowiella coeruleoviolacea]|uniref:Nucleotide-binding universal stress protein, UspA family n=1 Tax=Goodfellowiella coeruleoviolacea TaxID=334858 RepID=A0AAE3GJM6_9PSEU|nr:universal stress protein [Goodfellowiella coeruleoviolacea]MCP2168569.1 Nucleotide-binding universal stress protein, UspA family [Goodfellowiella coeruleoviolacea]
MAGQQGYQIVVGVDGSPASKAALRWAVWQAGLTRGTVTALMAWDAPPLYDFELPAELDPEHLAARTLTDAVREVTAEAGAEPVTVHTRIAQGNAAKALLDAAKDADLLVVGSRGHGGFTGLLLGSVSLHCTQHANCPVVVIRLPRS